jgi:cytoskeletal protein CcmA (bactofilin family)
MFKSSSNERVSETTVISNGTYIEGKMRARGTVQIDGEIVGILEVDGQVSIGPDGKINGEVIGDNVAVGGHVQGKVTARGHLHVVKSGVVEGDVYYGSFEIDRGALLDGRTFHASTLKDKADITDDIKGKTDDKPNGAKSPKPLTAVS